MSSGAALFETDSDDESEQLNRIREKLQQRRAAKPAATDSDDSSNDDDSDSDSDSDSSDDDEQAAAYKGNSSKHWNAKSIALKSSTPTAATATTVAKSKVAAKNSTSRSSPIKSNRAPPVKENDKKDSDDFDDDSFPDLDDAQLAAIDLLPKPQHGTLSDIDNSSSNSDSNSGDVAVVLVVGGPAQQKTASEKDDSFSDLDDADLAGIDLVPRSGSKSKSGPQNLPQPPPTKLTADKERAASLGSPFFHSDDDNVSSVIDEAKWNAVDFQVASRKLGNSNSDDKSYSSEPKNAAAVSAAATAKNTSSPPNVKFSGNHSTPVSSNKNPAPLPLATKNPYQTKPKAISVGVAKHTVDTRKHTTTAKQPAHSFLPAVLQAQPPIPGSATKQRQQPQHHHTCVYEHVASADEWLDETPYNSEPLSQGHGSSGSPTNVDAFGFAMEDENTKPRGGQGAAQEPREAPNASDRGKDFSGAKVARSDKHLPRESQGRDLVLDVDAAFGFGEEPAGTNSRNEPTSNHLSGNDRASEIAPYLYVPQPRDVSQEPIVHQFTAHNRPVNTRRLLPVSKVFDHPVNTLWRGKFDTFNQLQSEIANMLAYSDDNVVVAAPTGAGKTAVFEMAVARFFAIDLKAPSVEHRESAKISKRRKIVYVSPSKALCEERYEDWSKRLSAMNLGIEMAVVTGDGDPGESFHDLASAHFHSLHTREDALTRRWTEKFYLFASVKLFMVDEVHLIADESRGCCLETIICRMKTIQRAASQVKVTQAQLSSSSYAQTSPDAVNSVIRFVAVSATLPNISDVATFFDAHEAHDFDSSYRPVPLTTYAIGQGTLGTDSSSQWHFWKNFDRNVPEIIIRYSDQRPSIVFCHSKADTEKLADLLATAHRIGNRTGNTAAIASQTRINKLQRVLMHGIGYHHAGLEVDDRRLVEQAFKDGKIRVLCCTSTLAMGVNLPAHLVVIKGTKAWRGGGNGYQDLDQSSLLQMIGRAGRPGFDTSGTAVIMTDNASKAKFQRLASSGLEAAKSQCKGDKLVETINSAVSQGEITSSETAINWMKSTLYYRQLVKGHGVKVVSSHSIDLHLLNVCRSAIERLCAIGALEMTDDQAIFPLAASHIMSQNLVAFQAMTQITKLAFDASQCRVLKALAEIEGLQRPVRRSEKRALNAAHKKLKLYKLEGAPSKVRVQDPWEKAFVLLQVYVEELQLEGNDYALRTEMASMVDFASRMLAAIEEYSVKGSKHGNVVFQSLKLRRSFAVHLWNAKDGVLRQIKGVGKALSFSLHMAGISTFEDVMISNEAQIEQAANRSPPFGADLQKVCGSIIRSRLKISASIETATGSATPSSFHCRLEHINAEGDLHGNPDSSRKMQVTYTLIGYTDRPGGIVLFKENVASPGCFQCLIPPTFGKITIRLVASLVGLDDVLELEGNAETTPSSLCNRQPNTRQKGTRDDPRMQQAKRTVTTSGSQAVTQNRLVGLKPKASVTPSPKPLPSLQTQQPRRRTNQTTMTDAYGVQTKQAQPQRLSQVQPARISTQTTISSVYGVQTKHTQRVPSTKQANHSREVFRPPHVTQNEKRSPMPIQGCRVRASLLSVQPAHTSKSQVGLSRHDHGQTLAHHGVGNSQSRSPYGQSQSHAPYAQGQERHANGAKRPAESARQGAFATGAASWELLKRKQQKSQKRAFVSKSENPFSRYNHDPNESESMLDSLSARNKDSIIPEHGLRILARAYKNSQPKERVATLTHPRRSRQRGRVSEPSTQEILAKKSQELNAPPPSSRGGSQYGYVQQTEQAYYEAQQPPDQTELSYEQSWRDHDVMQLQPEHHSNNQGWNEKSDIDGGRLTEEDEYGIQQDQADYQCPMETMDMEQSNHSQSITSLLHSGYQVEEQWEQQSIQPQHQSVEPNVPEHEYQLDSNRGREGGRYQMDDNDIDMTFF